MTSLSRRCTRRGRVLLPAVACVGVAVLLGAAVITARLATFTAVGNDAADDQVYGPQASTSAADASGTGSCVPEPAHPRQLHEWAHQPVIAPMTLGAAQPARPRLRALTTAVTSSTCERADGAYAYVQLREWVIANTAATGTAVLQYEHWLTADGSGRSTSVTTRMPVDENRPTDETFPPDASLVNPTPLDDDPAIPAAHLDSTNAFALGPQSVLRALADISQWQAPRRNVRAAALAVLADTDGLRYHGAVTDRAGRTGAAISAASDNGGTRDLIIVDTRTGALLAHEQTAMRDPGALGITAPTVVTYTLYAAHAHTATVQQR
ncbi:hypothetical protein [Actinoplanes sp. ATCC 53533]|uniref:hypothetical protein n=1 Tax=Actinoplanes sp. ATCC 53533 TaxID=1288362 RepID=UPI000F77AF74|nr:hypothetical protein [Actinoplanes sp. ATCC 53533]